MYRVVCTLSKTLPRKITSKEVDSPAFNTYTGSYTVSMGSSMGSSEDRGTELTFDLKKEAWKTGESPDIELR